jgi:hypothetical protein
MKPMVSPLLNYLFSFEISRVFVHIPNLSLTTFFFLFVCLYSGLRLTRQELYCWSHIPALFALVILELGLTFCPGQPEPQSSHFILSLQHTQIFSIEMCSQKLFSFYIAWDDRQEPLCPAIG